MNKLKTLALIGMASLLAMVTQAQTNTVPQPSIGSGLLTIGEAIYNASPTNFAIAPYGTYVVSAHKFGYGLLAAYNVSQHIGIVAGIDHIDQFLGVNGGIQLSLPLRPLARFGFTNLVVTPFVISALGTPFGGAGNANGGLQTINSAGADIAIGHVLGGRFILGAAAGTRTGAGAYGGEYINAFFGYKRGF